MQPMITIIGGIIIYLALSYIIHGIFAWSDKLERRKREESKL